MHATLPNPQSTDADSVHTFVHTQTMIHGLIRRHRVETDCSHSSTACSTPSHDRAAALISTALSSQPLLDDVLLDDRATSSISHLDGQVLVEHVYIEHRVFLLVVHSAKLRRLEGRIQLREERGLIGGVSRARRQRPLTQLLVALAKQAHVVTPPSQLIRRETLQVVVVVPGDLRVAILHAILCRRGSGFRCGLEDVIWHRTLLQLLPNLAVTLARLVRHSRRREGRPIGTVATAAVCESLAEGNAASIG
mmetsp:Transcript_25191/g.64061  ORF Transcript_25191/g.64061 Transcript_25191/m.64061 type:complete len:250 (+) Transcript_25191:239-988(+)